MESPKGQGFHPLIAKGQWPVMSGQTNASPNARGFALWWNKGLNKGVHPQSDASMLFYAFFNIVGHQEMGYAPNWSTMGNN